jgi:hypothetical protein
MVSKLLGIFGCHTHSKHRNNYRITERIRYCGGERLGIDFALKCPGENLPAYVYSYRFE